METIPDNYDLISSGCMRMSRINGWNNGRCASAAGDHIQADYCYDVGGEIYCEDCMVSCFRKVV